MLYYTILYYTILYYTALAHGVQKGGGIGAAGRGGTPQWRRRRRPITSARLICINLYMPWNPIAFSEYSME